jgi:hypothetical protein
MARIVEQILVVLGLKKNEFDAGAKSAKAETSNLVNELKGATSASGLLQTALASAGVMGLAHMAKEAASAAFEMAKLGAGAERMETAFTDLASQAGGSADEMLAALQRATEGTVSNAALISSANRGILLGLGANAEQWEDLAEVARYRSRAMGISMTQALNDIVTGLGRESRLILDNLGIIVDVEKVTSDYAATLGTTADKLTETQRKQALLNSVIEDGKAKIEASGGLTKDAADEVEALGAAWANLKEELGKQIAPVVIPIIQEITQVIVEGDTGLGRYQADMNAKLTEGFVTTEQAAAATLKYGNAWETVGTQVAGVGTEVQDVAGKLAAWDAGFRQAGASANNIRKIIAGINYDLGNLDLDELGAGLESALSSAQSAAAGLAGTASFSVAEGLYANAQAQLEALYAEAAQVGRNMTELELAYREQAIMDSLRDTVGLYEDAGKDAADAFGDAFEDMKSTVAAALQPTSVSALDFMPGREDAWDENARRLDAIAARGGAELVAHPDWASILMIPPDVLAAGDEALKAWAQQTSDDVRNLFRPDLLTGSLDQMVETVRGYVLDQEAREGTIEDVTAAYQAKYGGSAADAKKMAKMLLGDTSQVGETVADDLAAGMKKSMGQGSLTATLVATWKTDVDNNKKDLQDAGGRIWDVLFGGIRQAVKDQDPSLIQVIAEKVAPAVARILSNNWQGAN